MSSEVAGKALLSLASYVWKKSSLDRELSNFLIAADSQLAPSGLSDEIAKRRARSAIQRFIEDIAVELDGFVSAEFRLSDEFSGNLSSLAKSFRKVSLTISEVADLHSGATTASAIVEGLVDSRKLVVDGPADHRKALRTIAEVAIEILGAYSAEHPQVQTILARRQAGDLEEAVSRLGLILKHVISVQRSELSVDDEIEARYRKTVAHRFGRVQLFGVRAAAQLRNLPIDGIYLSLSAELLDSRESKRVRVDEIVDEGGQLITLRGEAGSGKTTALHQIAKRLSVAPPNEEAPLPVYVPLRQVDFEDGMKLPSVSSLVRDNASVVGDLISGEWISKRLRQGRFVLLLDGLDEVEGEDRGRLNDWLDEILAAYPNMGVVVSGRNSAVTDVFGESGHDFIQYAIQPMDFDEIRELITLWHDTVRSMLLGQGAEAFAVNEAHLRLMNLISHRFELRRLAARPLLCSILCTLNYSSGGTLPTTRSRLYGSCLDTLLEDRDSARAIASSVWDALSLEEKYAVLGELARRHAELGSRPISYEILVEIVDALVLPSLRSRTRLGTDGKIGPRKVARVFLERSGVLIQPIRGEIEFAHEMIVFACTLTNLPERKRFFERLVKSLDANPKKRTSKQELLIIALESYASDELPEEVRDSVDQVIRQNIPPRARRVATDVLPRSGRFSVPPLREFLESSAEAETTDVRNTLRTVERLLTVDLETAQSLATIVASDNRPKVLGALGGMLSTVENPKRFAREALSDADFSQTVIEVRSVKALDAVKVIRPIRSLKANFIGSITTLQDLPKENRVEELVVDSCRRLRTFGGIENLSRLRRVSARNSGIEDIDAVGHLQKLRRLDLAGCRNLHRVDALSAATSLRWLSLDGTNSKIESLEGLPKLENLSAASLIRFAPVDLDLDRFEVTKMSRIRLSGTALASFSRERLISVDELILEGTSLTSIQGIEGLHASTIDLSGLPELRDLSPLASLSGLRVLYLDRATGVGSLDAIPQNQGLELLSLHHCNLKVDMATLSGLGSVTKLDLSGNSLVDFGAIQGMERLKSLNLADTDGVDLSVLSELPDLEEVFVDRDMVEEFHNLLPEVTVFTGDFWARYVE